MSDKYYAIEKVRVFSKEFFDRENIESKLDPVPLKKDFFYYATEIICFPIDKGLNFFEWMDDGFCNLRDYFSRTNIK